MVHIIPDIESNIQHILELSPRQWMNHTSDGKRDTISKMKDLDMIHFETFRHYRYIVFYISKIITHIAFIIKLKLNDKLYAE